MENRLKCPNCTSLAIIKNGFTRARGQRYKCKDCRRTFDVGTVNLQRRRFRIIRSTVGLIVKDLFIGLVLAVFLISAKVAFEHHYGHGILLATYDFLQTRLVGKSDLVVVVDISDIETKQVKANRILTDRQRLLEIINFLARQTPPPKAIGIDIDFSSNSGVMEKGSEFHDPNNDRALFERCLELKRSGIPVVLSVFSARRLDPRDWLGSAEFTELVGNNQAFSYHNRESIYSTQYELRAAPIMSFGGQLAKQSGSQPTHAPGIWERLGLIELFTQRDSAAMLANGTIEHSKTISHLIDYSAIANIEAEQVVGITADGNVDATNLENNWGKIGGKIVILGASARDSNADPSFPVAGFWRRSFKGVFLHASSVYTLVESPIYSLTHRGQIWIDVILSLSVLFFVAAGRFWNLNSIPGRQLTEGSAKLVLEETKLPLRVTLGAILLAITVGVVFINLTRVIWIDFVLVIIALILHQLLERYMHIGLHFVGRIWFTIRSSLFEKLKAEK